MVSAATALSAWSWYFLSRVMKYPSYLSKKSACACSGPTGRRMVAMPLASAICFSLGRSLTKPPTWPAITHGLVEQVFAIEDAVRVRAVGEADLVAAEELALLHQAGKEPLSEIVFRRTDPGI